MSARFGPFDRANWKAAPARIQIQICEMEMRSPIGWATPRADSSLSALITCANRVRRRQCGHSKTLLLRPHANQTVSRKAGRARGGPLMSWLAVLRLGLLGLRTQSGRAGHSGGSLSPQSAAGSPDKMPAARRPPKRISADPVQPSNWSRLRIEPSRGLADQGRRQTIYV